MNWLRSNYSPILSILTTVLVGAILIMLVNVQSQNAMRLKNQRKILDQLQESTNILQASNDRQTKYIQCLLAAHGESQLIGSDVEAECTRIINNTVINITPDDASNPQTPTATQAPVQPSTPTPPQPPQRNPIVAPVVDGVNNVLKRLGL